MIEVPVSWGELLDKITILEIKVQRLHSPLQLANVQRELGLLAQRVKAAGGEAADPVMGGDLMRELRAVNQELWDVEDRIRDCERAGDFGPRFVDLARSVYITNDRRAALKRAINQAMGSHLVEEKSYAAY